MAHGRIIMVVSNDDQLINVIPQAYKDDHSVLCATSMRQAKATYDAWKTRIGRIYLDTSTPYSTNQANEPASKMIENFIKTRGAAGTEVILISQPIDRFDQPTVSPADLVEDIATFLTTPV